MPMAIKPPIDAYPNLVLKIQKTVNVHQLPNSEKLSIAMNVSLNLDSPFVTHSEIRIMKNQNMASATQGNGQ